MLWSHVVQIDYEYVVAGGRYRSSYTTPDLEKTVKQARIYADQLKSHKSIDVYFDNSHPGYSTLSMPPTPRGSAAYIILPMLLVCLLWNYIATGTWPVIHRLDEFDRR